MGGAISQSYCVILVKCMFVNVTNNDLSDVSATVTEWRHIKLMMMMMNMSPLYPELLHTVQLEKVHFSVIYYLFLPCNMHLNFKWCMYVIEKCIVLLQAYVITLYKHMMYL